MVKGRGLSGGGQALFRAYRRSELLGGAKGDGCVAKAAGECWLVKWRRGERPTGHGAMVVWGVVFKGGQGVLA